MAAGIEHLNGVAAPSFDVLPFAQYALRLEKRNREMNAFISNLISRLRSESIYAVLVKGQGIAQCYERPLWRACGDIDLFLDSPNYLLAKSYLIPFASSVEDEDADLKHQEMTLNDWVVELHGTLRGGLWKRVVRGIDEVQEEVFTGGTVRSWTNGEVEVYLPGASQDVVLAFSHILQHFFKGGIGLRQICDWCRLLWTYRNSIDIAYLKSRLRAMGIMTEWKVFASIAVNYLGCPESAMPLYSDSFVWRRKARRVLAFILETGNFGHNRDVSYIHNSPYLIRKTISLWRHTWDGVRYFFIFPIDSVRVWFGMLRFGFKREIGRAHV